MEFDEFRNALGEFWNDSLNTIEQAYWLSIKNKVLEIANISLKAARSVSESASELFNIGGETAFLTASQSILEVNWDSELMYELAQNVVGIFKNGGKEAFTVVVKSILNVGQHDGYVAWWVARHSSSYLKATTIKNFDEIASWILEISQKNRAASEQLAKDINEILTIAGFDGLREVILFIKNFITADDQGILAWNFTKNISKILNLIEMKNLNEFIENIYKVKYKNLDAARSLLDKASDFLRRSNFNTFKYFCGEIIKLAELTSRPTRGLKNKNMGVYEEHSPVTMYVVEYSADIFELLNFNGFKEYIQFIQKVAKKSWHGSTQIVCKSVEVLKELITLKKKALPIVYNAVLMVFDKYDTPFGRKVFEKSPSTILSLDGEDLTIETILNGAIENDSDKKLVTELLR